MAPATKNRKTDVVREFRRVVIKVPLCVGQLIDLVANYQFRTKTDLADDIWRAGLVAYFGIDAKEIDDLRPAPLPRGTQPSEDAQELASSLLQ